MDKRKIPRNIINTNWCPELAYGIGLITSDGCLRKDNLQIQFVSKDLEMVILYCKALGIVKPARKLARGGETDKKYFYLYFKSKQFHLFLRQIGLTPNKSKTIKSVNVPDEYFADFFRGLYDGDGTFWTEWDKRWPNSFVYHLAISSASRMFLVWLKNKLSEFYGVKGFIVRGDGVFTIRYAKGDSKKLFEVMYYKDDLLYLSRKYRKINDALAFDQKIKHGSSQAAVAQW